MASILRPVALLSLASYALSSPVAGERSSTDEPQLFARAACKDNLGRCFNPTGTKPTDIASRSAATAFCSSFLSIPVVTSVIDTTTPYTLITVTETVTASTEIQTSTSVSDVEATETSLTTVTTILTEAPAKRALATAALPNCATGASRSPEEFSSACSCVSVTPSTTYVTATAPVATNTDVETSSVTTTTVTVEITSVTTGTETVVATATATLTPSPPQQLCNSAANPYVVDGHAYTQYCDRYYYGSGHVIRSSGNVASFSDCVQYCSDTPGCVYAYWVASTSAYSDKLWCYTFNVFTPSQLHAAPGVDGFSLNA